MATSRSIAAFFFAFASSCTGCLGCKSPTDQPGSDLPASGCEVDAGVLTAEPLDVLLVIDNSSSMIEEQEGVAREVTAFVDELKKSGGVAANFHVGMITTSVYQHTKVNGVEFLKAYPTFSGRLQPVPDAAPDGGVILGTGTERMLSGDDPDLVTKVARLVRQGTQGSGQETPYEAVRLAVTDLDKVAPALGGNAGFLRDGARLLVVVVSDEDDCSEKVRPPIVFVGDDPLVDDCLDQSNSLNPVSDYFATFNGLKDEHGRAREVIWTEIAPVSTVNKAAMTVVEGGQVRNVDCPTSNAPGFRHRQMCEAFDKSLANLDSICRSSYRDTLVAIAGLANVSQTLAIGQVPDARMLQIAIIRKDGTEQTCTLSNGGLLQYNPPVDSLPGRVSFGNQCKRRADDRQLDIRMLCIN